MKLRPMGASAPSILLKMKYLPLSRAMASDVRLMRMSVEGTCEVGWLIEGATKRYLCTRRAFLWEGSGRRMQESRHIRPPLLSEGLANLRPHDPHERIVYVNIRRAGMENSQERRFASRH